MQTARDAPADYGSEFAETCMAFEVTSASETEDCNVVTLSLRPQGDFGGAPGREQFFIEKEGTVAYRQVMGLPQSGTDWHQGDHTRPGAGNIVSRKACSSRWGNW